MTQAGVRAMAFSAARSMCAQGEVPKARPCCTKKGTKRLTHSRQCSCNHATCYTAHMPAACLSVTQTQINACRTAHAAPQTSSWHRTGRCKHRQGMKGAGCRLLPCSHRMLKRHFHSPACSPPRSTSAQRQLQRVSESVCGGHFAKRRWNTR